MSETMLWVVWDVALVAIFAGVTRLAWIVVQNFSKPRGKAKRS